MRAFLRSVGLWCTAACVLVGAMRAAHAQSSATPIDTEARASAGSAYDQGTVAYAARDFARAAHWFETADRLVPSEVALSAAVRSHSHIEDAASAARAASLALRLAARYPNSFRAMLLANETMQHFGPQLERVTIQCQDCQVEVDQVLLASTDFFVTPGNHQIVAHWSGERTVPRSLTAAAGRTETISVTAPPLEAHPRPPQLVAASSAPPAAERPLVSGAHTREVENSGLPPAVAVVSAVIAVGLAGVATWSVLDTYYGSLDYRTTPTMAGYNDGVGRELRSDILVPVAGVALAWTLVDLVFLTRWHRTHVEVMTGSNALGLRGTF